MSFQCRLLGIVTLLHSWRYPLVTLIPLGLELTFSYSLPSSFCVPCPPLIPAKPWSDEQSEWFKQQLPLFIKRDKGRGEFLKDIKVKFLKQFLDVIDFDGLRKVSLLPYTMP